MVPVINRPVPFQDINSMIGGTPPEIIGAEHASQPQTAKYSEVSAAKKNVLRHKVTSADTLVGVAIRYGVSVPELKAANKLSSNEIWMLNELVVPCPSVPSDFIETSPEMIQSADASQQAIALQRMTDCKDVSQARVFLRLAHNEMKKGLHIAEAVKLASSNFDVPVDEVLSYIHMFGDDVERGIKELGDEISWERQHNVPYRPLSFNPDPRAYFRLRNPDQSDEPHSPYPIELEMKKTK